MCEFDPGEKNIVVKNKIYIYIYVIANVYIVYAISFMKSAGL
jgi:hypothetical protein